MALKHSLIDQFIIVCTINSFKLQLVKSQLSQSLFFKEPSSIDKLSSTLTAICHGTRQNLAVKPSLIDDCIIVSIVYYCY